jgi:hypothetical protein
MNIYIRTIPHESQRYETVGDWYFDNEEHPQTLFIFVSNLGNPLYEFLIAYHEQIEAMLCLKAGIKERDVTEFDKQYERERAEDDFTSEPGDDPQAPYYVQHQTATRMERALALEMGINWSAYEEAVYSL